MKYKFNKLLENYLRLTVKDINTVYPKASILIFNSDLSTILTRDANKPTPYVPSISSLLQPNYEIIPHLITHSFRRCANYP